ncbi:MAG: alpha/beta hydrolase [Planctomycetota bacterium]
MKPTLTLLARIAINPRFCLGLVLAATLWIFPPTCQAQNAFELEKDVIYAKRGEQELKLDVYSPKDESEELRPAILVVHGGAWRYGNRKQLASYATALSERGYVCFAINYRLAPKHKFPAQIEDCRDAVKFIREQASKYTVDAKRIGAVGYSAGGHLVSLLATTGEATEEGNTRVQAVVAGGAPTEFRFMPDGGKGLAYWLGESGKDNDNYKLASATAFISKDDCPVFFFNGDSDKVVPLMWTQPLLDGLKKAGVTAEMYKIEGAGHLQAAGDGKALQAAWDFFDKQLQSESEVVGKISSTSAP